ncbi:DNA polymerase IV [Ruminiclostridium herbifermentans]|uniref:DNA polymerase IV n=1 Tax=Ruminiclostridium herbifermentans TaxID=2488810 RepID=A0A4U7JHE4_9FIRM|nr:DNA polymerase IV [Ruminiclostridium herbifermentans]QNU66120.1 DNA polymerase IV [Ruminiclostridium herbifermentans]
MQNVIFLVDMNAFYISCEMTRNPSLVGKPSAVAGDPKNRSGIILAANYEARAFGVKTAMVLHEALKLCPKMNIVPPDHAFYELKSNQVMDILSNYSPTIEQNSIDEAWLDMTGTECLFGTPLESAKRIMNEIKDKLGLWCSIGISENKFLSKMASELKKPLGITELWKNDIQIKLWPLPVKAMYGIGKKTADRLNQLGIQTIGELAKYDRNRLVKALGKYGDEIYLHANGHDTSPLEPHISGDMKSIGRSTTLPNDITDLESAKLVLLELTEDIGMTARKYGKNARTVHITIKYSDFKVVTRQTTIPPTCVTNAIYQAACNLLEQNWNRFRPIRLIGVSISGFDADCATGQLSLFDLNEDCINHDSIFDDKLERMDRTIDKIRTKHGIDKICRAALIQKNTPNNDK